MWIFGNFIIIYLNINKINFIPILTPFKRFIYPVKVFVQFENSLPFVHIATFSFLKLLFFGLKVLHVTYNYHHFHVCCCFVQKRDWFSCIHSFCFACPYFLVFLRCILGGVFGRITDYIFLDYFGCFFHYLVHLELFEVDFV